MWTRSLIAFVWLSVTRAEVLFGDSFDTAGKISTIESAAGSSLTFSATSSSCFGVENTDGTSCFSGTDVGSSCSDNTCQGLDSLFDAHWPGPFLAMKNAPASGAAAA